MKSITDSVSDSAFVVSIVFESMVGLVSGVNESGDVEKTGVDFFIAMMIKVAPVVF